MRNRRWLGATALGLLGLAAGDRGAAAGAADRRPALPGQRPDPAALARGDEAGGDARAGASASRSAAIVIGVAGVAWAAPERTTDHAGTGAIALALALVAIPIALPYAAARDGPRRPGIARRGQRRLRLRLDGDRQQAAHRRARGGRAARRRRLARHRGRLRGAGAAQRDERAAAAAGDPRGAGDVRRPGPGPGDPRAADLRRVVGDDAARRRALVAFMAVAVAGTVLLAGSRAVGARDRDRARRRRDWSRIWSRC